MQLIKELGNGATKKAFLYEADGQRIVILQAVRKSKQRSLIWQARREANITQNLPPLPCDIRTVYVKRRQGKWEVSAHYVEGEALDKQLFDTLTQEDKEKLITDFAEFLIALHSLPVDMLGERYADEADKRGLRYYLGAFCYKIYCLKKTYLSLKKPWENPYKTRKFAKEKNSLYRQLDLTPAATDQLESVLRAVCKHPDLFAYAGVCFGDFFGSNFVYNKVTRQIGILDFVCSYKNNIYSDFAGILTWMGEEFTQHLIQTYNTLAQQRRVKLPKCTAPTPEIDFTMVQHLAALWLFPRAAKNPKRKEELLALLQALYPTPA